jgi:hypothetical protein
MKSMVRWTKFRINRLAYLQKSTPQMRGAFVRYLIEFGSCRLRAAYVRIRNFYLYTRYYRVGQMLIEL